jgi:hypothetical protein
MIVDLAFLHSTDSRWRSARFVAKTYRRYKATRNSSENSRMSTRSLADTKTATNSFDSHKWLDTKLFVPECVSLVRIPSTVANGRGAERNAASMVACRSSSLDYYHPSTACSLPDSSLRKLHLVVLVQAFALEDPRSIISEASRLARKRRCCSTIAPLFLRSNLCCRRGVVVDASNDS